MHVFNGYPFSGSSIRNLWLLINFLIYFKVALIQAFLTSGDNLVNSVKLQVSGMKCDTSDPDSQKFPCGIFRIIWKIFPSYLCKVPKQHVCLLQWW